ncbi:unnamed protein product [Peniophora sp. CBMAI 1063]|nr:unnamed protein product [Peniophora sp. CBMAI 1063]
MSSVETIQRSDIITPTKSSARSDEPALFDFFNFIHQQLKVMNLGLARQNAAFEAEQREEQAQQLKIIADIHLSLDNLNTTFRSESKAVASAVEKGFGEMNAALQQNHQASLKEKDQLLSLLDRYVPAK